MAQTIEDVNSRTLLQQFHSLYKKQDAIETNVENVDAKVEQEKIDRQTSDLSINSEIQALKDQIDSLGVLFTYKGEVATIQDLPLTDNVPGDVYYVDSEQSGYVWLEKSGVYQWEQFGPAIDLSEYAKQEDLEQLESEVDAMNTQVETNASNIVSLTNTKQDKLTAGTNITIDANNVISASGGGSAPENMVTTNTEQEITAPKTWSSEDNDFINEVIVSTDGFMINRTEKSNNKQYHASFIPDGVQLYTENNDGSNKTVAFLCDGGIAVIDDDGQGTSSMSNVEIRNTGNDEQLAYLSDIPVYGCSITVTDANSISYLACINGKWTEYNSTQTLSNCSEVKINNGSGRFDNTTGYANVEFDIDASNTNHIYVTDNNATITIIAQGGGGN